MKISSRFTIALHTLLCIDRFAPEQKVTSEFIAGSVNVNPVIIRNILGQLKDAGIIDVARGKGGACILKPYEEITLLDVFNAVGSLEAELFSFHERPNPKCPVGGKVHTVLDDYLADAQKALEKELKKTTLKDLSQKLVNLNGEI